MTTTPEMTRRDFMKLKFRATHAHKKGGKYEHATRAIATDKIVEGETVVVYVHESGIAYVRPARLFDEADRFAPIDGEKWEKG